MQNAKGVIKRLKDFLNIKTDLELSQVLGVKPNTISSWKKRNSLQFETIIALCKKNNIDLNDLFYSESNAFKPEISKISKEVRLISSEIYFQYLMDPVATVNNLPIYSFPFAEDVEIGFQVISENMAPTVRVTSYVICKSVAPSNFQVGEIFVLHLANKGLFVHRFKREDSNGKLVFSSDNAAFEDITIDRSDIVGAFIVKGAFLPCFRGLIS